MVELAFSEVVDRVIKSYGSAKAAAESLGYSSPMAIYNFRSRGLPKSRLVDIHLDTGMALADLQKGLRPAGSRDAA